MKHLSTTLVAAAVLICATSSAFAQDPFWSLLSPRAAPVVAVEGREGETFFTVAAQHREVGFLENDIRGTGLVNSDRIVIPRGTPVFRAAFGSGGDSVSAGRQYEGWCGVVQERGRALGYCMLRQGSGYVLGRLPDDDSFYAPTRLANYGLRPITTPDVRIDGAARDQLPAIEFSYALDAWRPSGVVLERSVVVEGRSYRLGSIFVDRRQDGTAQLSVGDYGFVLSIANGGEGITIAPNN